MFPNIWDGWGEETLLHYAAAAAALKPPVFVWRAALKVRRWLNMGPTAGCVYWRAVSSQWSAAAIVCCEVLWRFQLKVPGVRTRAWFRRQVIFCIAKISWIKEHILRRKSDYKSPSHFLWRAHCARCPYLQLLHERVNLLTCWVKRPDIFRWYAAFWGF